MKQDKIKFDEKKHKYYVDSKELVSVTTWISKFFPKFEKSKISKRVAKFRRAKGEKVTAWDIQREWKAVAQAGTSIHEQIENSILTGECVCQEPKAAWGYDWYQKTHGHLFSEVEQIIYDEDLGLAGTIDLVCVDQDQITLIDWKSGKMDNRQHGKPTNPAVEGVRNSKLGKATLQLSVYAYMLDREGHDIKELKVVHLKEDGCEVYTVSYLKEVVERMLKYDGKL